jgi:hypothetical protein
MLRGESIRRGPRVRFRPELGFSTKPVIGPAITLVKRFILRLLRYVFDDLARQTDAAIARVEREPKRPPVPGAKGRQRLTPVGSLEGME